MAGFMGRDNADIAIPTSPSPSLPAPTTTSPSPPATTSGDRSPRASSASPNDSSTKEVLRGTQHYDDLAADLAAIKEQLKRRGHLIDVVESSGQQQLSDNVESNEPFLPTSPDEAPERPSQRPWRVPKWTSSAPGRYPPPTSSRAKRPMPRRRMVWIVFAILTLSLLTYIADRVATSDRSVEPVNRANRPRQLCPNDLFVLNVAAEACYLFAHSPVENVPLDWKAAENHCEQLGANLARIDSKAEQEWLNRFIELAFKEVNTGFWLGGKKDTDERWIWEDNGKLMSSSWFQNWRNGKPPVKANKCLVMKLGGIWDSAPCSNATPFICKAYIGD